MASSVLTVASVAKIKKIIFLSAILFLSVRAFQKDEHSEELFIKPLSKGYVYSHFQFTTKWNASIQDPKTCKKNCKIKMTNVHVVDSNFSIRSRF